LRREAEMVETAKECFCTLVTSDSYVLGAQALVLSLLKHNSEKATRDIVVLHTEAVSKSALRPLRKIKQTVLKLVEKIDGDAFQKRSVESWSDMTKLRVWTLVEYDKVAYLDADMLVRENLDDLFRLELGNLKFAAAPDVFPPDKFNAGLLVLQPDMNLFSDMMAALQTTRSYDGGDTGFLNAFFPQWFTAPSQNRLPFSYNAQRTLFWMTHDSQPGYWDSIGPVKVIHYSSHPKPWLDSTKKGDLEMLWWSTFSDLLALHIDGQI